MPCACSATSATGYPADISAYAIKNLMEVENSATDGDREVRFAREFLDSSELGVSYFRYPPGYQATGGHRHEVQEEAYVVVGGAGRVKLDDESRELRKWDVVRVAPSVVRGFDAGPEGLELIAIGGALPDEPDGEPVKDRWADESEKGG